MTFTIPQLTPRGLLLVQLSTASPGVPPRLTSGYLPTTTASRLRRFPLYTALPCAMVGRHPHEYYHRTATSPSEGFVSVLGASTPAHAGRFPFPVLSPLRASEDSSGRHPPDYSALSFASRTRLPTFAIEDSACSLRWWFVTIPSSY